MAIEETKMETGNPGLPGLRMRDLVRESGLKRETIHFYLSEGLLPAPVKTGQNTALYDERHLERLRQIQDLQAKHFLPLKAIRAVFEDEPAEDSEDFTPGQVDLLRRVRWLLKQNGADADWVPLPCVEDGRITEEELSQVEALGLIALQRDGGRLLADPAGAELVDAWAGLKAAGLTPERGFSLDQLDIYVKPMEAVVRAEIDLFSENFSAEALDPSEIVAEAVPQVERILTVLHRQLLRRFLSQFSAR